jgi:hypothetical protein
MITPQLAPVAATEVVSEIHIAAPQAQNVVRINKSWSGVPGVKPETGRLIHIVEPQIQRTTTALVELKKNLVLSFSETECESVTLANRAGDITVLGTDDNRCRIEIKITAKGKDAKAAKHLAEQVQITTGQDKKILTIVPEVPNNSKEAQVTVAFTLRIPRTLNLNLTTQVGNITVHNMQSRVNCHANVGNIKAQATTKTLNVNTNVGEIYLTVTDDTDARISAFSNLGKIQSKQAFTLSPPNEMGVKGTLTLGSGKIPVNLRVNVGSIHVGSQAAIDKVGKSKTEAKAYKRTTTRR